MLFQNLKSFAANVCTSSSRSTTSIHIPCNPSTCSLPIAYKLWICISIEAHHLHTPKPLSPRSSCDFNLFAMQDVSVLPGEAQASTHNSCQSSTFNVRGPDIDAIHPAIHEHQHSKLGSPPRSMRIISRQNINPSRSLPPTRPTSSGQCGHNTSESSTDAVDASIAHTAKTPSQEKSVTDPETALEDRMPHAVAVPRAQRRGLFGSGRFTMLAEVTEPKHYSRGKKWLITSVIAVAASAAPAGSAILLRRDPFKTAYDASTDCGLSQPHYLQYPTSFTSNPQ